MRRVAAILLVLLGAARLSAQDSLRVLFIGNSHTYVNNLPALVESLAVAGGHPLRTGMSALGGFTLAMHLGNPATLAALEAQAWDRVVLQEQSQIPVIPYWRDALMYPSAVALDSLIRLRGAQTLLYMTWGWESGGLQCFEDSCSVEFRDYQHMQDSVSVAYRGLAEVLGCGLAPVGEVWRRVIQADPFALLWAGDGYHPALEGSYLGACAFYHELFGESPVGLSFTAGLDSTRARWLQEQAAAELGLRPRSAPTRPGDFGLQAWPNPFNPATTVSLSLERPQSVRLSVCNLLGQEVAVLVDGSLPAGRSAFRWDATGCASGLYFVTLTVGQELIETRALSLVR